MSDFDAPKKRLENCCIRGSVLAADPADIRLLLDEVERLNTKYAVAMGALEGMGERVEKAEAELAESARNYQAVGANWRDAEDRADRAEAELAEIRLELRKTDPRDLPLSNVEMIQRLQAELAAEREHPDLLPQAHVIDLGKALKDSLAARKVKP